MVISIFDLKKFCTKNTTNRKKANQTNCTYQKVLMMNKQSTKLKTKKNAHPPKKHC